MKNAHWKMAVLAGCGMLLSVTHLQAQDWPQWRGPNRDAKAAGFNAPKEWPKELTEKWKVKVGNGVATPDLVGDKLYVFTREGDNEILRCLDAATGKELWQDKYEAEPARGPAGSFPGPRSSPAVADGKVVTLGVQGTVSCFDATGGKLLWRKDDFKGSVPRFFTSSSPLIIDGLCIVQLGGDNHGAMVAYDLSAGDEKWKWDGNGTAYASPVVLTMDGAKEIVAETADHVVGIEVGNGKRRWEVPFKVRYNACTPMVDGQTVIYSGSGSGTRAVKIEKDGDNLAPKELWKNDDTAVQFNTPVVKNGLIFGLSDKDNLFCLNAENGKTAWSVPKPRPSGAPPANAEAKGGGKGPPQGGGKGKGMRGGRGMGGGGYGSIVDADSVLLALTPSSELIVFQPSDKEFKQLAKYKVSSTPTYAYPVLSGNRIFIKDGDSVTLWTVE